jgi:ketosteroid isomerase-like protein
MQTKEIVESYYDGVAQKRWWESIISEEIAFTGPGINSKGKNAYVEATARFLRAVKISKVIQMIIEGDNVCAIVRYDLESPKGNRMSSDVAEILSVRNGKIDSSTIFFDTIAFKEFTAKG